MTNIICLNEANIKHDLYTVVDLNNTKRIYINMFISGGSVDVLDSVHEIMQKVKSVERKKYETRTA